MQPGETLNQDALGQRLNVDKANVTRALSALVKSGYIQRVRSAEDRRQMLVSMTDAGVQARQQVVAHAQSWVEGLKSPLSPAEWEQLSQLLTKVCDHQLASKKHVTHPLA